MSITSIPSTDADTLDGFSSEGFLRKLTVSDFRKNPATGTAFNPEDINDGSLMTDCTFQALTEYCEIDFGDYFPITEFRHNGFLNVNEDGKFKIQHWDGTAWIDNTIDIMQVKNVWSSWLPLTTFIVTNKIRVVATLMDTYSGFNYMAEMEMRG